MNCNTLYLVRDKKTGLYWRGMKVRHSVVVRTAWTESPAKAWHSWQENQVERLFLGAGGASSGVDYEIVRFSMIEHPTP